ncbi:hypothetical protein EG329_013824 [Mollisiaceae sp. DMI_Dod_QoI]|nr:hypothetical protein EG329_013824 [Helotiales sp. DMI_Dod_QoI]
MESCIGQTTFEDGGTGNNFTKSPAKSLIEAVASDTEQLEVNTQGERLFHDLAQTTAGMSSPDLLTMSTDTSLKEVAMNTSNQSLPLIEAPLPGLVAKKSSDGTDAETLEITTEDVALCDRTHSKESENDMQAEILGRGSDEALLSICKDLSRSLRKLESYLEYQLKEGNEGHDAEKQCHIQGTTEVNGVVERSDKSHALQPVETPTPGPQQDQLLTKIYYRNTSLDRLQQLSTEYGGHHHDSWIEPVMDKLSPGEELDGEVVDEIPKMTREGWNSYTPFANIEENHVRNYFRGRGRGRNNFDWGYILHECRDLSSRWQPSYCISTIPYSQTVQYDLPGQELFQPLTKEQHTIFAASLGGLYTLPGDDRLPLPFQWYEQKLLKPDYLENLSSALKDLVDMGGSFEVQDFDDHGKKPFLHGRARYGHNNKRRALRTSTARDAEEYLLNITPITVNINMNFAGNSPWRRLIICHGIANLKDASFLFDMESEVWSQRFRNQKKWSGILNRERATYSAGLHICCSRQSIRELHSKLAQELFHINWFAIERLDAIVTKPLDTLAAPVSVGQWKQGRFYGSKFQTLGVKSFTVQTFESRKSPINGKYWTILIFAPLWSSDIGKGATKMVNTESIKFGHLLVTMLSAIEKGFSVAVECWIIIGNELEELIGNEELILDPVAHDKFCFYDGNDDDFARAKKCFWIINSIDKFERSMSDTLHQWKWYAERHIGDPSIHQNTSYHDALEWGYKENESLYEQLNAQRERFLSIQKEARELRDGLFGASNLINAKDSVAEARNSAKLGRTVELLTLVTIFFLPLGYCTSLWAILAAPDLKTFVGVSVGTAFATYLAVLLLIKSDFSWEKMAKTMQWPQGHQQGGKEGEVPESGKRGWTSWLHKYERKKTRETDGVQMSDGTSPA